MRTLLPRWSALLVLGLLAGGTWAAPAPAPPVEDTTHLVAVTNDFGFRLLTAMGKRGDAQNLLLSPVSLEMALGMTYAGAAGNTRAAIGKALGVGTMTPAAVGGTNAQLLGLLHAADSAVTLTLADSLWSDDNKPLNPAFVKQVTRDYGAEVKTVDFASPAAAAKINGWVSEQTQKKIEKIIENTDANDLLYLINTVYFKGRWQTAFDKALTKDQPFLLPTGKSIALPMMRTRGKFRYVEDETIQGIVLPYGKGRLSMVILLPNADVTLEEFRRALTAANWHNWLTHTTEQEGSLQLPRFSARFSGEMIAPLSALGMGVAFSGNADFRDMFIQPRGARISEVLHGTALTVDEEGATAAAATVVKMTRGAPRRHTFTMVVDHPFFCAIRDDKTGAILFMGTVVNPEK